MENFADLLEDAKIALVLAGKDEALYLQILPPLFPPYDSYPTDDWPLPVTMRQAVDQLLLLTTVETKLAVRDLSKSELIHLHFSLCLFIRNQFGLWRRNEALIHDAKIYKELGGGKEMIDGLESIDPRIRQEILDQWEFFLDADSASGPIAEAFWWELQDYKWPELTGDFSQLRCEEG